MLGRSRQLHQVQNLRAWIFRVCFNTAKDMQRSAWNRRVKPLRGEEFMVATNEPAPVQAMEYKESVERLARPSWACARRRKCFLLRAKRRADYEQIAELRHVPVGTVKTQMRSALEKLRKLPELARLEFTAEDAERCGGKTERIGARTLSDYPLRSLVLAVKNPLAAKTTPRTTAMMNCETCQARLLHHLYGLLDGRRDRGGSLHLDGCPACRAAQDKRGSSSRSWRSPQGPFPRRALRAGAALPRDGPTLLLKGPAGPRRWVRWAWPRASFFCLLFRGFTAVVWQTYSAATERASEELRKAQQPQADFLARQSRDEQAVQHDMAKIEEQIKLIEAQFRDELNRVKTEYDNQKRPVQHHAPKTLQAGGANKLTSRPRSRRPRPSSITAFTPRWSMRRASRSCTART